MDRASIGRRRRSCASSCWPHLTRHRARRRQRFPGKIPGLVRSSDIDKAIQENMKFTLELADKILLSAGKDPTDAFIKAIGTLAQVIYIITPDDQREQTLNDTIRSLKTYLELLDAVAGPSSATIQPSR
jgi:hypothetical protein